MAAQSWPDGHTILLAELWADGYSCSLIAAELHKRFGVSYSRGAVIGKVNRLNLPARQTTTSKSGRVYNERGRPMKTLRRVKRQIERARAVKPADDTAIPFEQRKSLIELTRHTCRWPVGEPREPGFFFCGAVPAEGQPYCVRHCAVAFVRRPDKPMRRAA